MATAEEMTLRPVRPADRDRVVEMTRDVWNGRDYLPRVFDRWVGDAGAAFQAAEVEGVVVGVQRLRPYAPGLIWYEGLRVAAEHRRHGIARAMLDAAIEDAREQKFRELRLATRDVPAVNLFESAASQGFELYGGVCPDLNGARDMDADEMERLARNGLLRVGPAGRAVAALREAWGQNVAVSLLAGTGGALRELLMALRFEADADSLNHVTVNLPPGHPAEDDLRASGYDFADAEASAYVYALSL